MIEQIIAKATVSAIQQLYGQTINLENIQVQETNPEFEGDLTVVIFPLLKISHKTPEATGNEIGGFICQHLPEITGFTTVKGFLNLSISNKFYLDFLQQQSANTNFGFTKQEDGAPFIVEFSSPNTNKPLHLGHIRNNLLGHSVSEILKANGKKVIKANLVNDRGIHICKSMLAWRLWGNEETPESSGMKGDHLIGKYYVLFDKKMKEEIAGMVARGMAQEEAEKSSSLMAQAHGMLVKWEKHHPETVTLWKTMNGWVYRGFDVTYKNLGISFDKTYYESETYLLGKDIVEKGLKEGVLYQKEDGSVWADLTGDGLDEKLLLRSDGTSVYITQDLGTAKLRYEEFAPQKLIYVVGNEQNYHFDVLTLVLKKLGYPWAEAIYHLNYGMVELPHGKMKSREGTVVDADDLMQEMTETARATSEQLGKTENFTEEELDHLFHIVGLAALKYFILRVDPKKNMLFNPVESIDFNGNTGPFIQYTYARIQSLLRKASAEAENEALNTALELLPKEKNVLKLLYNFPSTVKQAGDMLSPATIANYAFELAKNFNAFYQEVPILKEEDTQKRHFRLLLTAFTGTVIKKAMSLLGIEVPERM